MLKVRIGGSAEFIQEYIDTLDMKKSLGGHLMIFNHKDINVVVKLKERKIVAYSKGNFSDVVYNTQNRFFNYLMEHGFVEPETVRGSNVFGSLLAEYPENKDIKNISDVVLYNIALFMLEENDYMETVRKMETEREEELLHPSDKDSTDLGDVPQETSKGSMRPYYPGYSYGLAGIYMYE